MIECIFTIDYEIYGNGQGNLKELVYEPAEKLMAIFHRAGARFVSFVEAAELELIEAHRTDETIDLVAEQVRQLHAEGFEIGLHLHPQWYNAHLQDGTWVLDESEYNLCTLKQERIEWMVGNAIRYLREVLNEPGFVPLSFRAGNWLLQPTHTVAGILAANGIRIDSSVFKGGLQRGRGLDYRPALRNGYYWTFGGDVNVEDPEGVLLEIPIHTRLVPPWRMLTAKRVALQQKGNAAAHKTAAWSRRQRMKRGWDYLRLWHPLKFDFCRMGIGELKRMIDGVIREDQKSPNAFRPLVAIGHTKDLNDFDTIVTFLSYLKERCVKVSTFKEVYDRCRSREARMRSDVLKN